MELKVNGRTIENLQGVIGLQNDSGLETIKFTLPRYYGETDLSRGLCHLLLKYPSGELGYVYLSKETAVETITATWLVGADATRETGVIQAQLKISGLENTLWHSEITRFTVARSLPVETPQPVQFRSARTAQPENESPITIAERRIVIPSELQNISVQNDENSETVAIVVPRWFDGHDLDIYSAVMKTISSGGRDDLLLEKVGKTESELRFSWTLRPPQTSYSGTLQLQIRFEGEEFKWETEAASVNIITSLDDAPVIPTTPSILDDFVQQVATLAGQAAASKDAAKLSQDAAKASETNAKASETAAAGSAADAEASNQAAKTAQAGAEKSAAAALASQNAAKVSETNAKASETASKDSETKAKASETAAKGSQDAAKLSEDKAKGSEEATEAAKVAAETARDNAQAKAEAAEESALKAKASEDAAKASETASKGSETEAGKSAGQAANSATAAAGSAEAAATSEANAAGSAGTASTKATEADASAKLSKSYAVGGTGTRDGEDTDNAKYYKEQTIISTAVAQDSAQTATEKATEAASSAESAARDAASIGEAAETATTKAEEAKASAETAKTEADRAKDIVGGDYATRTELNTGLAGKVDAVDGKGLSSEDYTSQEKAKLAGIEAGATNYQHPATHPASMITGLGDAATKNVGITAGTVAAGNHGHDGTYQPAGDYATTEYVNDGLSQKATLLKQTNIDELKETGIYNCVECTSIDPHFSAYLSAYPCLVCVLNVGGEVSQCLWFIGGTLIRSLNGTEWVISAIATYADMDNVDAISQKINHQFPDGWVSGYTPYKNFQALCYGNGSFVCVCDGADGKGGIYRWLSRRENGWTSSSGTPRLSYRDICYGNKLFVALAYNGPTAIVTSKNGLDWTTKNAPSGFNAICYGEGLFVAVGDGSSGEYVMTSPDGTTWTTKASPLNGIWSDVCYGNGIYVVVAKELVNGGAGNWIMTSTDGETWIGRKGSSSTSGTGWSSICYGNGRFVAVPLDGTKGVLTSSDGINWTEQAAKRDAGWNSICFGYGMFVAVTTGKGIFSTDGVNWTSFSLPDNPWKSICFGDSTFFAIASEGENQAVSHTIGLRDRDDDLQKQISELQATDIGALPISVGTLTGKLTVGAGPTESMDVATKGYVDGKTTADINWKSNTLPLVGRWRSIAANDQVFIALNESSDAPCVACSYDRGTTWEKFPLAANAGWYSIAEDTGVFVIISFGSDKATFTLDNGETWGYSTLPLVERWAAIAGYKGTFVCTTDQSNAAAYSTDGGRTWNASTLPSKGAWDCLTVINGVFVTLCAHSNKAAYSTDGGKTWSLSLLPLEGWWTSVAANARVLVAVAAGFSTTTVRSVDNGKTWEVGSMPKGTWMSVQAYNGLFVALTSGNLFAISMDDGISWITGILPVQAEFQDMAQNEGTFIGVAGYGSDVSVYGDISIIVNSIPVALEDHTHEEYAPVTCGTSDLTVGTSDLATGSVYLVYE